MRKALQAYNTPGIRVLRCGIDIERNEIHEEYATPQKYPKQSVAYTTTHDTETLMGMLEKMNSRQIQILCSTVGVPFSESHLAIAQSVLSAVIKSPSRYVIIPIQDWLLTTDRINIPGTEDEKHDKNWQFTLPVPIEKLPLITF